MTDPPPDDAATADLIDRARAGDGDAYDELFVRTGPRLELYLRVRLGRGLRAVEETGDLLQETWLAAHRALADFEPRGRGSFARWLCRIAENRIRARADHHGAGKRPPPEHAERLSRVVGRLAADDTGVATRADRVDRRERLAAALEALPDDERTALVMRHFEGQEIAAIADALQTSATTARRILGRATVRLGERFETVEEEG